MLTWIAFVVACTEKESQVPTSPAAEVAPTAPLAGNAADVALLAQPPPAPGPAARALAAVAEHFNVGLVRCPLADGGRVRQLFGNERDQLWSNGPTWALEIDPAGEPSWDVLFDAVVSDAGWVTALVMPGWTNTFVATRDRVVQYTFPPAVAGQTVVCTQVEDVPFRIVRGRVEGEVAPLTAVFPCLEQPAQVARDGSFAVQLPVPCRMWVEGGGARSEKTRIEPGDEPVELTLHLSPDPLQTADRQWTKAGIAAAEPLLVAIDQRYLALEAWFPTLEAAFPGDAKVASVIHRWRFDHARWGRDIQRRQAELDVAAGRKPRPIDRLASPPRPTPATNPPR